MKCCLLQKVTYRLAGTSRHIWAVVLAQREGLSLLFVQRPDEGRSHALVVAAENPAERIFEDAAVNRFPLENADLENIGNKLEALGDGLSEAEFKKFFDSDDFL